MTRLERIRGLLEGVRFASFLIVVAIPLTLGLAWAYSQLSPELQLLSYVLNTVMLLAPSIVRLYDRLEKLLSSESKQSRD